MKNKRKIYIINMLLSVKQMKGKSMSYIKSILIFYMLFNIIGCTNIENNAEVLIDIFNMNIENNEYRMAENVYDESKSYKDFIDGIDNILMEKTKSVEENISYDNIDVAEEYIIFLDNIGQAELGEPLKDKIKDLRDTQNDEE